MRIELYGVLREAAGASEVELQVSGPVAVESMLDELAGQVPGLAPHLPRAACAVGDSLVSRHHTLDGSQTVAILPPVSGG